jgi:hypothetical protein
MSQDPPGTFVKVQNSSRFDGDERDYLSLMYRNELFGAFLTACRIRLEEEGFTRTELGRRMEKEKARISRLLANPSNMTATTVAEFANAVEADIAFCLVDRKDRDRLFTGGGVERMSAYRANAPQTITISIGVTRRDVTPRVYSSNVVASFIAPSPTEVFAYGNRPMVSIISGEKRD